MAILATMLVFMAVHMQREARGLRQLQLLSSQERLANDLLMRIEAQLDYAQGVLPTATLVSSLPSGESFVVDVDRPDGTGFSYRVPVDPAGVSWGAVVGGRPAEDGRICIYFEPVAVLQERARNFDFNRDGDLDDAFDLGRLRQRAWDAVDSGNVSSDIPLCPPIILQEHNAWGSDLDGDDFEDPMFIWTPQSGRLRIRLFALVGTVHQGEVVKRYETVLHLRNGAAQ